MKILFIGNSYTFFNDMPAMLEALALENGNEIIQHSVTKGGRHLYENLQDGDAYGEKIKELITQNDYDVLILQEQSFFAIVDFDKFVYGVKALKELVKAKRTILYSTWGRKTGSPKLEELGLTSEEMTEKLTKAYISASSITNSEISPVGTAFLKIARAMPETDLYKPDLSHPSYIGSAVGAICHYRAIFGKMPTVTDSLDLGETERKTLLSIISEAFDEK